MNIRQEAVQAVEGLPKRYNNYKHFDFATLCSTYGRQPGDFLHDYGITFEDFVSDLYMTGNELLYYPELTKELRTLEDYPCLKRTYEVDKKIQGMKFIQYFFDYVLECFNHFWTDFNEASRVVNQWIDCYGGHRHIPIVNGLETENKTGYYTRKKLIINGIAWYVEQDKYKKVNITEIINFRRLFNISLAFEQIRLETIIPDTPYICLRLGKTWSHKGHVNWYDLDTRQRISKPKLAISK